MCVFSGCSHLKGVFKAFFKKHHFEEEKEELKTEKKNEEDNLTMKNTGFKLAIDAFKSENPRVLHAAIPSLKKDTNSTIFVISPVLADRLKTDFVGTFSCLFKNFLSHLHAVLSIGSCLNLV